MRSNQILIKLINFWSTFDEAEKKRSIRDSKTNNVRNVADQSREKSWEKGCIFNLGHPPRALQGLMTFLAADDYHHKNN